MFSSYDCNGTNAQKWIINRDTTSVQVAGTNYCLDAGSCKPPSVLFTSLSSDAKTRLHS